MFNFLWHKKDKYPVHHEDHIVHSSGLNNTYKNYKKYTPFDAINEIISSPYADKKYWMSNPDQLIHVCMDNGKEFDMRLIVKQDCISNDGRQKYWFAFDNHEYNEYKSEIDFTNHILKWKFIKK